MMSGVAADLMRCSVLLLLLLSFGCLKSQEVGSMVLAGKKVLVVIAPEGFQDHEFSATVKALESAGANVTIASTRTGTCTGKFGTVVNAIDLGSVSYQDYDAIVFIGGPGVPLVRRDERAIEAAQSFAQQGKVVAAICWAPTILAKAGVLKGKKATVWEGFDPEYGKSTADVLRQYGADFESKPVVVDGCVVTANGPMAAEEFGATLVKVIANCTQ